MQTLLESGDGTITNGAERLRAQAAALDANAEDLVAQARALREGAVELRLEAERLERAPLRMVTNNRSHGNGSSGQHDTEFMGRICELLAGSGRLSTGEIADHLNATAGRARVALARLETIGMVRKTGLKRGTRYELTDDVGEDEAEPPKTFGQDYATVVRDTAKRLDTFDFPTIQAELPDVAEPTIRRWLKHWTEQGMLDVERDGVRKLYAFVKPEGETPARPKRATPEQEVARMSGIVMPRRGDAVIGTGANGSLGSSKAVNELRRDATRAGVKVEKESGGHLRWIVQEGEHAGEFVRSSSTPGASSMKDTRSKLRKLGVVGV